MALNIFKKYATDEAAESNGTWINLGDGAEVLVARLGNKAYGKMLGKEFQANKRILDLGEDSEEADAKSNEIMANVLAETILLDWKGVEGEDGKPMEYNKDNARKVLGLKEFRAEIMRLAGDVENYRLKQIADAKKQ